MKINGVGPSNIVKIYNDNKVKASKSSEGIGAKSDSLQISQEGRSLSNITIGTGLVSISDPKHVEAVKNQIEQGTYKPNSNKIAQKMLDSIRGREA